MPSMISPMPAVLIKIPSHCPLATTFVSPVTIWTPASSAAVLNEVAGASNVGIIIDEDKLPIREKVQGVCDILGFDVLELANEGKFIAFVPNDEVESVLNVMHNHRYGVNAAVIGEVMAESRGKVGLRTSIGSIRVVDMPLGAIVPRIC